MILSVLMHGFIIEWKKLSLEQVVVKNWNFWCCRSQEPVPMWEEPGSWYKNQGSRNLGFWEPVTPGEEPGSEFKIYKENNFFCGNRFPVWRNRVPHTKFQGRVF